jgi:hypothetical protein
MKHPYDNTVDPYFRDIVNECRQFLTLHGIEVVTKEMQEGIRIGDVTKVSIKAVDGEEDEEPELRPYYSPLDKEEVNSHGFMISCVRTM